MGDPIRVLHVDDDSSFAEMAASLLEREDDQFVIEIANGADEGKKLLEDSSFDCVISDYDMPKTNGIEFLESVREEHPDLPFILFTGKGSEAVASDAISTGVTEYLQKQGSTEQYELLAHRIKNAVEQHRTTRRAKTLDRIRTLIADVSGALVRASTRKEMETSVCEIMSEADPYCFAWIGSVDEDTGYIEPQTWIGAQEEYLDEITLTADDSPTGRGPAGQAISEQQLAVTQDVEADPKFKPWRSAALDRGFRAAAGVPLVHDGTVYGVLVVYASRTNAFDESEQELLDELGTNISRAMHSLQNRVELEQTNSLLTTLLDLLPVGVLAEDGDRNVLAANRRLLELCGLSGTPDELVGADCAALTEEASDLFADPAAFLDRLEGLMMARQPVDDEGLQLRDGRTFERSYRPIELPDSDGHLWTYRDTTERTERRREREQRAKALEEMSTRLETQYRYLFERAPVMAAITREEDGEPIIEECNQQLADRLGHDKEEMIGRPLAEFYTEKSVSNMLDDGAYQRALDGEVLQDHRQFETADGDIIETEERAVPGPDPRAPDRTLGLYIDITRQERLEREKARLESFTDVISHDLRSPLSVAEGRLALLGDECDSEHIAPIERAHERMETLLENLLALARSGKRPEAMESVDLDGIVDDCWQTVETTNARLVTDVERTIQADRSQLKQLLENLFRNSVQHGSTGSQTESEDSVEDGSTGSRSQADDSVEHGTSGSDDRITITVGDLDDGFYVADDGVGIESDDHEKLFESGFSTTDGGTGLGLAIVERIAETHGWTIDAMDSEAGGIRFEITDVEIVGD
jgi:PAS domain S-box-containing protein